MREPEGIATLRLGISSERAGQNAENDTFAM